MRNSSILRFLLALSAFALPVLVHAQFQTPTQEELKMTADPKAPGAAAVYLNIEEIANDPLHYQSKYVRIKVLTEKGKELATVELPYLRGNTKIADLKGRTIHPDGTIVPLEAKPEDLLNAKIATKEGNFQFKHKIFTLPSVEVGSILEYSYQERYDDGIVSSPTWEIQQPYFVHKAHYVFTPVKDFQPGAQYKSSWDVIDENGDAANSLIWWPILPAGVAVKSNAGGHYSVDLTDIPALPNEDYMPPENAFKYKVSFYYKSAHNAQDFWVTAAKRWSKDVDRFAEPSKAIREAVNGLVAPTDSQMDKAKKLYKAVQALENTDYTRRKSEAELKQLKMKEAKHAEDTWAQKSGDSEDIALLYLAMARAAGLTASAVKVVDRKNNLFDVTYLSARQLDDTIILLMIDGKEVTLDPGEKMCAFQMLSWRHSTAGGFRQSTDGKFAVSTPSQGYTDNRTSRVAVLTLAASGAVSGDMSIVMSGQQALYWRQIALRNDPDEVKKQFDQWLESEVPEGVEAHLDHFAGMDDAEANLAALVKVKGQLGSSTSKRMILPAFFFETHAPHPFVGQEKRQTAVDMHYGELIADQVTYKLPVGMAVESAPQTSKELWPDHAVFKTGSKFDTGQVVVARTLARSFTFAKPEEYQDLRSFYQKVATSDQQQVVLTATPAAKGN
jgi:hypothetical protein